MSKTFRDVLKAIIAADAAKDNAKDKVGGWLKEMTTPPAQEAEPAVQEGPQQPDGVQLAKKFLQTAAQAGAAVATVVEESGLGEQVKTAAADAGEKATSTLKEKTKEKTRNMKPKQKP